MAAAAALVAVFLFATFGAVLLTMTLTTRKDAADTNRMVQARVEARSSLDIVAGILEQSGSTTAIEALAAGGPWLVNSTTGELVPCTDPVGEGCIELDVEVFDNGANNLVTVTAVAQVGCTQTGCLTRAALRDTFRERSLLDYILHSDSEALEDSTEPDCALPASQRPVICRQAAWNSILPAPSPQAIIAPGMMIAYTAPGATPTDFANSSSPINLDSNLTPTFTSATGTYTVVAVVNPDQVNTSTHQGVFTAQAASTLNSGFFLGLDASSASAFVQVGNGTISLANRILSAAPLTSATENVIAGIVEDGELFLYTNGTRSTGVTMVSSGIDFGSPQLGAGYAGTIAFQTFPTALTNTEIAAVGSALAAGIPTGWVEANGQALTAASYPALFSTIGATYGAAPAGSFRVPDMSGRVLTSQDVSQTGFDSLGETGGASTVSLSLSSLPSHNHTSPAHNHTFGAHNHTSSSHNHSGSTGAAGNHTHRVGWQGASAGSANSFIISSFNNAAQNGAGFTQATGNHSHGVAVNGKTVSLSAKAPGVSSATATTNSTGSNQGHENLQPYIVTRWLIATDADAILAPGMVAPYLVDSVTPPGWVDADGQSLDSTVETALYQAIGTTYGGSTAAFLTPNFAGRTPAGLDTSDAQFASLGQTGGSIAVTLTVAQLPSHTHSQAAHSHSGANHNHSTAAHSHSGSSGGGGNHSHLIAWDGSPGGTKNRLKLFAFARVPNGAGFTEGAGAHSHTVSIASKGTTVHSKAVAGSSKTAGALNPSGGGAAHNNLAPYSTVRWLVATAANPVLQPGMMLARADTSVGDPTSWVTPNGIPLDRISFDLLYNIMGDQYGNGDGVNTFDLPDFAGRVLVGYDPGSTQFDLLGETGGENTHTLTSNELPSHTHTQQAHSHPAINHNHTAASHNHSGFTGGKGNHTHLMGWNGSPGGNGNAFSVHQYGTKTTTGANITNAAGNHTHSVSVGSKAYTVHTAGAVTTNNSTQSHGSTGSNAAHQNLGPYITLRWLAAAAPSKISAPPDQIDHVAGPIHTNDDLLLICGSPTFTDVYVAGPAATPPYWAYATGANCNLGTPDIASGHTGFQQAEPLILPETEDWLDAAKTLPGTETYTGDVTITLTGATYTVSSPGIGTLSGLSFPPSGVLFVQGGPGGDPEVSIQGVINGRLSIVTEGKIVLPGNIRYQCGSLGSADIPSDCDDVLGLNAQNGVSIVYGAVTPGQDRTIHAAIAAVNGSVRVDRWATAKPPVGISPPTLYIAGSIVAQYRGVYGAYDGTTGELRSGYRKFFVYDQRFHVIQPPFFVSPAGTRWARVDTTDVPAGPLN